MIHYLTRRSRPHCRGAARPDVLACTALLCALAAAAAWWCTPPPRTAPGRMVSVASPTQAEPDEPDLDQLRGQAWLKVAARLQEADSASWALIDHQAGRVQEFFSRGRQAAQPFAEEVLGFRSKWEFAKAKLPFTDADGHERFLKECFERHLFTADDLQQCLQSAVAGYATALSGIENRFLTSARADLSDGDFLPRSASRTPSPVMRPFTANTPSCSPGWPRLPTRT
jgi:hypothetical protein